ncbi:hypothetical protein CTAYLR_007079 [Chrysophaeum taylorii]|uniref:RCK N-terminal domain-containing protein n=1 Tax=Chrysophaeum taylorii TaxID=2483200 RepID=A0AAD7UKW8_9STRA|nr:hypothetical protein CTAYLR_007079 [Chrysophaeum taylorii]
MMLLMVVAFAAGYNDGGIPLPPKGVVPLRRRVVTGGARRRKAAAAAAGVASGALAVAVAALAPAIAVDDTTIPMMDALPDVSRMIDAADDLGELVATDAPSSSIDLPRVEAIDAPDLAEFSGFSHDALVFLAATVVVTPACRLLGLSPILGYLVAGVALGPQGLDLFREMAIDDSLAEIGILFLLFEQGLELTLDRLEALRKYAFGLGSLQLVACSLAFGAFPFVGGVEFLERLVGAPPELVAITRPDEAIIIGAALSLSSSAFVLRLLQEKRQSDEEFALACLGVLLLQDIAVVPLLVLLPIVEDTQVLGFDANVAALATSALQSLALLGAILGVGRVVLRRVFAAVAGARSSETFVALCLLVVLGTGALTDAAGLSSTLGAFVAGTLLAETNFRARIEADIQPFRGLLLGLFFVTTGANVDLQLLALEWPTATALLLGQLAFKAAIVAFFAEIVFGLPRREAIRTSLLLAGGGEFAFVVLTLATRLGVLPPQLARLDTAVVVVAMALTPALGALGDWIAATPPDFFSAARRDDDDDGLAAPLFDASPAGPSTDAPVVVVRGFGPEGQILAALLAEARPGLDYVALDDSPAAVAEARARGFPVVYGDASPGVLASLLDRPVAAFVLPRATPEEIARIRDAYPAAPIVATRLLEDDTEPARDLLFAAGSNQVVDERLETALDIGKALLVHLPAPRADDQAALANVRRRVLHRAALMRNVVGDAKSTVSGGGFDLDATRPRAVDPGARARAAKRLSIFAGYDDDDDDNNNEKDS